MTSHAHDVALEVRRYMAVFGALLALTLVTVGVSYLHMAPAPTIAVAIAIAVIKASLVGLFFMHLRSERAVVYWTLGLTAFLFVALIAFLLWTEADHLFGTRFTGAFGGTE